MTDLIANDYHSYCKYESFAVKGLAFADRRFRGERNGEEMTRSFDRPSEPPTNVETERPRPRQLASEALLQGATELEILHEGEIYRLRRTGRGKLLLTK